MLFLDEEEYLFLICFFIRKDLFFIRIFLALVFGELIISNEEEIIMIGLYLVRNRYWGINYYVYYIFLFDY